MLKLYLGRDETVSVVLQTWASQNTEGNCIKFAHLCFLILCSKTLQTANELTYEVLHNSSISSQWSISELLTEKSYDLWNQSAYMHFCRRKISGFFFWCCVCIYSSHSRKGGKQRRELKWGRRWGQRIWKVTRERQPRPEYAMVLRLRARVREAQRPAGRKAVER